MLNDDLYYNNYGIMKESMYPVIMMLNAKIAESEQLGKYRGRRNLHKRIRIASKIRLTNKIRSSRMNTFKLL